MKLLADQFVVTGNRYCAEASSLDLPPDFEFGHSKYGKYRSGMILEVNGSDIEMFVSILEYFTSTREIAAWILKPVDSKLDLELMIEND